MRGICIYLWLLFIGISPILSQEFSWDTITFEETYEYISIGSENDNTWEIGTPLKDYFMSPYKGSNVIVTDVRNGYPSSNHSYFDLYLGAFNIDHYPYSVGIEFYHRIATDVGRDGAYIEVSHDNGQSWVNIIEDRSACINPRDGIQGSSGLYSEFDTLYNGEFGFSGYYEEWKKTSFCWMACLTKDLELEGDTTIVRFNFISDQYLDGLDGWMIDDIRLYSKKIPGLVSENMNDKIRVFPNPASSYLRVISEDNLSLISLSLLDLNGRIVRRLVNSEQIDISGEEPGFYFLEICTGEDKIYRKIFIQ